jgi:hypothetical protein
MRRAALPPQLRQPAPPLRLVCCHICGNAACIRAFHMAMDTNSVDKRMVAVHRDAVSTIIRPRTRRR